MTKKTTNLDDYKQSQKLRDKRIKSLEIQTEILKLNSSSLQKRGSTKDIEFLTKLIRKINSFYDKNL